MSARFHFQTILICLFVALMGDVASGQVCEVSIDQVTNMVSDTDLIAGHTHQFSFRLNVVCGVPGDHYNVTNGILIYSPEGDVDWGYTQGGFLPPWSYAQWTYYYVNHFHKANNSGTFAPTTSPAPGTDSVAVFFVGYSDLGAPSKGLPSLFNDVTWSIEIATNPSDGGKHICIDTTFTPPGGTWKWVSKSFNPNIYPLWAGPFCYRIFAGCCEGSRGNVLLDGNCDEADQTVDVVDLTSLIDHLFINFTPLCCPEEADLAPEDTPDGLVDVADLTMLIDHLFIRFQQLPTCR